MVPAGGQWLSSLTDRLRLPGRFLPTVAMVEMAASRTATLSAGVVALPRLAVGQVEGAGSLRLAAMEVMVRTAWSLESKPSGSRSASSLLGGGGGGGGGYDGDEGSGGSILGEAGHPGEAGECDEVALGGSGGDGGNVGRGVPGGPPESNGEDAVPGAWVGYGAGGGGGGGGNAHVGSLGGRVWSRRLWWRRRWRWWWWWWRRVLRREDSGQGA